MPLWRIYYHIVWTTKNREPLITPELETPLFGYIVGKANELGAIIHAINGTEDHVHLVISIPPKFAVADVVRQLKGASSHRINEASGKQAAFGWQRGYGVFSLGGKQLPEAIDYVSRQKEHHQSGTTIEWLERTDEQDEQ